MRDTQLAKAIGIGQIRDRVHLIRGRVAGRHPGLFERKRHHGVAGHLVREDIALDPIAETAVVRDRGAESGVFPGKLLIGRRLEKRRQPFDLFVGHGRRPASQTLPFGLDMSGENWEGHFLDQNLDPRLVDVVPPAKSVVDPQDRIEVIEHFLAGKELADHVADDGRTSHAAAD